MSYGLVTSEAVSPGRDLRRSHPQGRQARRIAGAGGEQVRDGDQSEDREGAGHHRAADHARPRRRGDRVKRRELITLLGGSAAWPVVAWALDCKMRKTT